MKTKYLVPQTVTLAVEGEYIMDTLLGTGTGPQPGTGGSGAPGRYAPGGRDLGGIPAA